MPDCKNCFWSIASPETWKTIEVYGKETAEEKINKIKNKKCTPCKEGTQNNFAEVWKCRTCGDVLDGHQYMWHDSLCEHCWIDECQKENKKED